MKIERFLKFIERGKMYNVHVVLNETCFFPFYSEELDKLHKEILDYSWKFEEEGNERDYGHNNKFICEKTLIRIVKKHMARSIKKENERRKNEKVQNPISA